MSISFGTDGIRGPVESFITPELCLKLGQAAGQVLKQEGLNSVLIGKDTRISGYMLESALEAGFIAAGINVKLLGPLPTPGVAYLTKSSRGQFGVVISASHNTYEDNGIKLFDSNGVKISKDLQIKIEKLISKNSLKVVPVDKLGKAKRFDDSGARYVEFCKSTVPHDISFKGLRIVLDCANGAAYKVTPTIFQELGAEIIPLGVNPDGYNINQNCGSTNPEYAKKAVLDHRADFGICLDGDADRVKLIDSSGNILDGDDILYILATGNKNRIGPWSGIVGTVMSNLGLEIAIKELGYEFQRSDVGDTYVNEILTQKGWYLGGEPSGHIICRDLVSTGDGTIAALKTIATLILLGKDCKETLQNFKRVPQVELSINVVNKDIINQENIQDKIREIKSDLTIGRILVRPSGTESKIRIMVEAESEITATKFAKELASLF
ncbi:MAG: phosphoglucosamine mutase [Gammaproteobacteria bacterium]